MFGSCGLHKYSASQADRRYASSHKLHTHTHHNHIWFYIGLVVKSGSREYLAHRVRFGFFLYTFKVDQQANLCVRFSSIETNQWSFPHTLIFPKCPQPNFCILHSTISLELRVVKATDLIAYCIIQNNSV